jgi:hypothetical protein
LGWARFWAIFFTNSSGHPGAKLPPRCELKADPVETASGLPDGLFSNPKSQFGKKYRGLCLENVDIFYGHLEHFMDIWDIL